MKKETSNERLRKAMKRIQSGEADKDEDSIEELEKQFALKKKQLQQRAKEEDRWISEKLDLMQELNRINERLDRIDKNLEKMKEYLPHN